MRLAWLLIPALAAAPAWSAPRKARKKLPRPMTAERPSADTPAETAFSSMGTGLSAQGDSLSVLWVRPGSRAAALKFATGDTLTHINLQSVKTRTEAGAAFRGLTPQCRASAVILRKLSVIPRSAASVALRKPPRRRSTDLSAYEKVFRDARMERMASAADSRIAAAPSLDFSIQKGQSVWIRFPKGIPLEAAPGDIIIGVTTTGVATDNNLDFLSIPPGTKMWATVMEDDGPPATRNVRLFFYKMKLYGGNYYKIAAQVTDISGDQRLTKVSPGGTIVKAYKTPVAPETRVRVSFLRPVTITEPDSFFQAGPGLWIKSLRDGDFTISHVISGRAAERAGLKPGDVLKKIGRKRSVKLDFPSALLALYGEAGSAVKLAIQRNPGSKAVRHVKLIRGVHYEEDTKLRVAFPYVLQRGTKASTSPKKQTPKKNKKKRKKLRPKKRSSR